MRIVLRRQGEVSADVKTLNFLGKFWLFKAGIFFGNPKGYELLKTYDDVFDSLLRGQVGVESSAIALKVRELMNGLLSLEAEFAGA